MDAWSITKLRGGLQMFVHGLCAELWRWQGEGRKGPWESQVSWGRAQESSGSTSDLAATGLSR